MSEQARRSVVVVGLGNPFRGDDGAGIAVADRLRSAGSACLRVVTGSAGGAGLLGSWNGEEDVYVVDSSRSGGRPGSVRRFDGLKDPLPERFLRASTHSVGVREAVALARYAGRLPRSMVVLAIEGGNFAAGARMSSEVEASVEEVVNLILRECSAQNAV